MFQFLGEVDLVGYQAGDEPVNPTVKEAAEAGSINSREIVQANAQSLDQRTDPFSIHPVHSAQIHYNLLQNLASTAGLAFGGCSLLGIALALFYARSRATERHSEQVFRELGVDVIGVLPSVPGKIRLSTRVPDSLLNSRGKQKFFAKVANYHEAMRGLRNRILTARRSRRVRSVAIASAFASEGRSTTAIHLAIAHAEEGGRTLIIDADLVRPVIQRQLKIDTYVGLSDVLEGHLHWTQAVKPVDGHRKLDLLPSGGRLQRPPVLSEGPFPQLLKQVTAVYDLVIIDTPSILQFPEAVQMASQADGVLVVAHADHTDSKALAAVLSALQRAHANVPGVALNRSKRSGFQALERLRVLLAVKSSSLHGFQSPLQ